MQLLSLRLWGLQRKEERGDTVILSYIISGDIISNVIIWNANHNL